MFGHADVRVFFFCSADNKKMEYHRKLLIYSALHARLATVLCDLVFNYVGSFEGALIDCIAFESPVTILTSVSDCEVATAHDNGYVRIYNLETRATHILCAHRRSVIDLAVLSTGNLATCDGERLVLCDLQTHDNLRVTSRAHKLCALPNGLLACATDYNMVHVWDTNGTPKIVQRLAADDQRINSLLLLEGHLAAGSVIGEISVWDLRTFKKLTREQEACLVMPPQSNVVLHNGPLARFTHDAAFAEWRLHANTLETNLYASYKAMVKLDDGTVLSGFANGTLCNLSTFAAANQDGVSALTQVAHWVIAASRNKLCVWN